jgi:UDP-N-acetylmuramyl pentapeptide synthase
VAQGLAAFEPVSGRSQATLLKIAGREITLVNDSYNANPDSVLAAIDVLAALPGPRWLVLGDMGEVGDKGDEFHAEVGRYARECGIDRLLLLGDMTRASAAAFGEGGAHFAALDALLAAVADEQAAGAAFLIKGSRFMKMERVVAALTGPENTAAKTNNNVKASPEMKASQ